ncbi:V-type proton ATPase subunit a [Aphelenchoides bicaudatus]|nr:V-type proton ATPase subunit a [Aphelenchoides bicaudatus]
MDAIHRSEEICLAQLFLQNEAAYQCVAELGELGVVQFRDLNPEVNPFQRKYVKEIRRCDEMERKLRYLEREIKKDSIPMLDTGENPEVPQAREMFDLEATFDKLENELREVNQNEEMLKKNFAELTELKHILRKTQQFFEESEGERQALDVLGHEDGSPVGADGVRLIDQHVDPQNAKAQLKFVAGVIQRERLPAFERLLWRACRGNVFLRQSEITESLIDAHTGNTVNKSVFIIFFQGEQLKSRVRKICEGFNATLYPCPDTPQERREILFWVKPQDHRHRVLVAAAKNVRMWMAKACKIKAIYHTLNLFNVDVTQKCLIAECWCPISDLDHIQLALKRGSEDSGSTVPSILNRMETSEMPPTYHRTNKFTRGFQNIVDAYGIASYREINPAPYTMITFPFLFALMFGDMGHGLIMFLAALFFILKEKQLEAARIKDEIFQNFFGGRYLIALMGLFSIYTGLIYNDCFSKSFNLFGSSFLNPFSAEELP